MTSAIIFRALLTWVLFVPLAFINGTARQLGYQKYVGELAAHQISVATGSVIFLAFSYFMMRNYVTGLNNRQLLLIGLAWLVLTEIFEFGMGLVAGRSWNYMLADYNVLRGRLWPVVLLVIFLSPFFIKWIQNK